MSANTFGTFFRVMTFGESHGKALGAVIDGCPAGVETSEELIQAALDLRRPGQSKSVSPRSEPDRVEILSGLFEGKTLGTPIAALVRNHDARSVDYEEVKNTPRVGHADDMYQEKFGHWDWRGGARASGRETLSRVIGGSVAQSFVRQVYAEAKIESEVFIGGEKWTDHLGLPTKETYGGNETYGGSVSLLASGISGRLGQPVFRKLKSDLAAAMMSIGATSAVEFGAGKSAAQAIGSEFHTCNENYGGIRGGISTGEPISLSVTFKPTASKKGRHDACIAIRARYVCEAMFWLVLADHILWARCDRI